MPELPEVETTRRGIEPHLQGKVICDVIVRRRQLRWPVPRSLDELSGAKIDAVERRAKYILLHSLAGSAIIHLGMSGSLRITGPGEEVRKHDHLDLVLSGGNSLRFHDPRRFGCVLWTREDPLQHQLLVDLGPEPLGDAFNGEHLFALSRKRKLAVKNYIMSGAVVVGVGNIYASEALFLAGIRPTIAAGRISRARYGILAKTIREVLAHAIEEGGTTLRDFVNPEGNPGYFKQSLFTYGREGEPCHRCGTPIRHKVIGQRASFFCPQCQPVS